MLQRAIRLAIGIFSISPLSSAVYAEPTHLVSRAGFECLVKNSSRYFKQGEEIFVDFSDCPLEPDIRERMRARQATNWLPKARPVEQAENGPVYTDLIMLSSEMLTCLIANQTEVLRKATEKDYVTILPASCVVE